MARILIIDDDPSIRETAARILQSRGHSVGEAADGATGVSYVWDQGADVVITDIFMPGQDGLKTVRELRAAFPELKIIAISAGYGSGLLSLLDEAESMGANETLPKPFTPQDLVAVVQRVLDG